MMNLSKTIARRVLLCSRARPCISFTRVSIAQRVPFQSSTGTHLFECACAVAHPGRKQLLASPLVLLNRERASEQEKSIIFCGTLACYVARAKIILTLVREQRSPSARGSSWRRVPRVVTFARRCRRLARCSTDWPGGPPTQLCERTRAELAMSFSAAENSFIIFVIITFAWGSFAAPLACSLARSRQDHIVGKDDGSN